MSGKPLPVMTEISKPFWEHAKAGQLTALQCGDCGRHTFYPRKHCQHCLSHAVSWVELRGQGTVYSFTIARIPTLPEFAAEQPQILAVIELAEGVRMNSTLVNVSEAEVHVGMPVVAVFDEVDAKGTTLVRFTKADGATPRTQAYKDPLASLPKNAHGKIQVPIDNLEALHALVSDAFSAWSNVYTVTQSVIDEFARLSGDDYWIHTDPVKAEKESPYGKTIAHGALVQILQSRLQLPLPYEITGFSTMVNYGSNKLRFPAPVPVDSDIHARARVKAVDVGHKGVQFILEIHTHIVGETRPSVINELVIFYR